MCALGLLLLVACVGANVKLDAVEDHPGEIVIPVTLHVATKRGQAVVTDAQIVASIRRANKSFEDYDIRIEVVKTFHLPRGYTHIVDGSDRVNLAQYAKRDGTLHVFFVDRVAMQDPEMGDRRVSGLHWRYSGLRWKMYQREYLVVAEDAPVTTLAHEVGHAFGLEHSEAEDNIMCSCRRGATPGFTDWQGEQMRRGALVFMNRSDGP